MQTIRYEFSADSTAATIVRVTMHNKLKIDETLR